MKKTLSVIAITAMLTAGSAYGLTSSTATTTTDITINTAETYGSEGDDIYYANGVLSGAGLSSNITFDMDYSKLTETATKLIYVTGDGSGGATWGFYTTAEKGITGLWQGNTWGNGGTIDYTTLSGLDTTPEDDSHTITLTANITDAGTYLYKGDSTAESDQIYGASGLKQSPKATTNTTLDTNLISTIYVQQVEEGATTYTSNGISVVKDAGTHENATNGRLQVNGGDAGNHSSISAAGNPIFVGGAGQLFLQTWGTGAITLDNDIYLGSSTHGDVAGYGVLRFGNDGGHATTLNGEIVVLENTSMKSSGDKAININGNVTDKKNIDGSVSEGGKTLTIGGKGYTFSGNVDVSNLDFAAGTAATFTNGFTTDSLTLGNNAAITSGTELTLAALTVGTGVTLDAALNLSEGATVTMAGALSLGDNALSMGSLTLSGDLMNAILGMTEGTTVNLFTNVTALTLNGALSDSLTEASNQDLSSFLTGVDTGKYYLGYENNTVYAGLVTPDAPVIDPTVPEPTTATLSLLALAALAARRRRR